MLFCVLLFFIILILWCWIPSVLMLVYFLWACLAHSFHIFALCDVICYGIGDFAWDCDVCSHDLCLFHPPTPSSLLCICFIDYTTKNVMNGCVSCCNCCWIRLISRMYLLCLACLLLWECYVACSIYMMCVMVGLVLLEIVLSTDRVMCWTCFWSVYYVPLDKFIAVCKTIY